MVSIQVGDSYAKQFDYDGSGNLVYEGQAQPGSATSSAVWSIAKYTYTGSNVSSRTWANGNNAMSNIWDNRVGLTYL